MEFGDMSPEELLDLEQSMSEEEIQKQKELEREWVLMYK
jgi:hypothetical protein|tara:strand:+ start:515 stop:631 length:117 start_codon:yes stop_codon:yes gene_type:complete